MQPRSGPDVAPPRNHAGRVAHEYGDARVPVVQAGGRFESEVLEHGPGPQIAHLQRVHWPDRSDPGLLARVICPCRTRAVETAVHAEPIARPPHLDPLALPPRPAAPAHPFPPPIRPRPPLPNP